MIPEDREELEILAGEFVLGVLDPIWSREIEAALPTHAALRRTITFWEEKLHPLSALAPPADPPDRSWEAISARLTPASGTRPKWSKTAAPWRWSTAVFAAAAAAILLYVALMPGAPPLIALLHPPRQEAANWIAVEGGGGLQLSAVARETPPRGHAFELWVIPAHAAHPMPLGVISPSGRLQLAALPHRIGEGATLAISVEPPGGSPTGLPTGPVVFLGVLHAS